MQIFYSYVVYKSPFTIRLILLILYQVESKFYGFEGFSWYLKQHVQMMYQNSYSLPNLVSFLYFFSFFFFIKSLFGTTRRKNLPQSQVRNKMYRTWALNKTADCVNNVRNQRPIPVYNWCKFYIDSTIKESATINSCWHPWGCLSVENVRKTKDVPCV